MQHISHCTTIFFLLYVNFFSIKKKIKSHVQLSTIFHIPYMFSIQKIRCDVTSNLFYILYNTGWKVSDCQCSLIGCIPECQYHLTVNSTAIIIRGIIIAPWKSMVLITIMLVTHDEVPLIFQSIKQLITSNQKVYNNYNKYMN